MTKNQIKRQAIDEHNYQYWLKKNTVNQGRSKTSKLTAKTATTKAQAYRSLMLALGVGLL